MVGINSVPYLSEPAVFFLVEILITCLIVRFAQELNDRNNISIYFEEFFCCAQLVILSFEVGVLKTAYGPIGFAAGIFVATLIYGKTFRSGIFTNLGANVDVYAQQQNLPVVELVVHLAVQLLAAFCGWQYIRFVWSLPGTSVHHTANLGTATACTTQIQTVLPFAIAVEAALTFLFRVVVDREGRYRSGPVLSALTAVSCVFAGLNYTGGYFNPTSASALQFNCTGHSAREFLAVYFLGPTIGAFFAGILGDTVWRFVPSFIENSL